MANQEKFLLQYLQATSWRQLLAIMGNYHFSTSTRQIKESVIQHLHQYLTNIETLTTSVAQLDTNAKDALRRLLAADGALPVHTFEERYGPIRPYKPWRKGGEAGPSQPWLAPISTTETLWYLGLIYRDPPKRKPGVVQRYVVPVELAGRDRGAVVAEASGQGTVDRSQWAVDSQAVGGAVPAADCTMPKQPVNTLWAPTHVQPLHLARLAQLCTWAVTTETVTPTPHIFTLDPARIGQLAAAGIPTVAMIKTVAAALGRNPSRRVVQRIRRWAEAGQQLAIRPLMVLEADSADRLAQLRVHKLVRNRLGAVIAPNRIALNPKDAAALA